jgi:adenylylsulfate kinase-like enzyme
LRDLQRWSTDPAAHRIFWLDGMAGTGKSAIARSFCRFLHENSLLGGSFFCLRGNES